MATNTNIEIYEDEAGEYRWRAIAGNNRRIANGGEGYKNKRDLENALDLLMDSLENPFNETGETEKDVPGSEEDTEMKTLGGPLWLPREIARLGHEQGWRDFKLVEMVAICRAESSFYQNAVGGPNPDGSLDFGLMQINSKHFQTFGYTNIEDFKNACFDAKMNFHFAHELYVNSSYTFHPWAAYTSERYVKYLRTAILGVANYWCADNHLELLYG